MDGNNQNPIDEDDDFEDFPSDGKHKEIILIHKIK